MLAWILAAGAALCLAYYMIIVIYAGIGTSFAAMWLCMGGLLGGAYGMFHYYQKHTNRSILWIPVSLITLCATGMLILLLLQILIFSRIPTTADQDLDYVIVLGAGVKPEGISKTLKLRLDKAVEYAAQNPDSILVLSGGQGAGETEPEAVSMQRYLLNRGVKREQMMLEQQSRSTVENLVLSKELILQQDGKRMQENQKHPGVPAPGSHGGAVPNWDELRVGVITSNFHLYRARMIAKKLGLGDVRGIAAESDSVLFVHFCMRDALAILKDRLMGNL